MENPSVQRLLDWYRKQQEGQKPEEGGETGLYYYRALYYDYATGRIALGIPMD